MAWAEKVFLEWQGFKLHIAKWDFPDEGVTCVFGESGSGKTTLLQILAGLLPCPHFRLLLQGELVTEQPARNRNISFVFQDYGLFPHMSVFENIAFAAQAKKIPQMMWSEQAEKLTRRLGLDPIRNQKARTLSGGEQQRVALARALVTKPRMVCLDEPLSALDEKMRDDARNLIAELSSEFKVPFIFVTHDLRDVRILSKSLLLISQGQFIASGLTQDLLSNPPTIAAAKAIPENQIIPLIKFNGSDSLNEIVLPSQKRRQTRNQLHSGPSQLVAKPWSFEVVPSNSKTKGLKAKVLRTVNEGPVWRVYCQLLDGRLIIAWSNLDVDPGQVMDLKIDVNSLILFEEV